MDAKSPAYEYLEQLQEKAYSQLSISPDDVLDVTNDRMLGGGEGSEFLERFLESYMKNSSPEERARVRGDIIGKYTDAQKLVPTKFENPVTYMLLASLAEEIEKSANDLAIEVPSSLLFGTLPTGRVNAIAVLVPNNQGYIILFEHQLFIFALLLSKVVAAALPLIEESEKNGYAFRLQMQTGRRTLKAIQWFSSAFLN